MKRTHIFRKPASFFDRRFYLLLALYGTLLVAVPFGAFFAFYGPGVPAAPALKVYLLMGAVLTGGAARDMTATGALAAAFVFYAAVAAALACATKFLFRVADEVAGA